MQTHFNSFPSVLFASVKRSNKVIKVHRMLNEPRLNYFDELDINIQVLFFWYCHFRIKVQSQCDAQVPDSQHCIEW